MKELQELSARLLSEAQAAASSKQVSEHRQKEAETRLVEIIRCVGRHVEYSSSFVCCFTALLQ
jgi:hypothetical protein